MRLIDLTHLIPDLIVDLRYATSDNFVGKKLYNTDAPLLDIHAAAALERTADWLRAKGYQLVLWDAYRPLEVQKQMLAAHGADNYLLQDSSHPKGLAVDVTIADQQGNYLDMGTEFDDFSKLAHADAAVSSLQKQNRKLLVDAMSSASFKQWPYEWWHFDYAHR